MSINDTTFFRTRDSILSDMLTKLLSAVPDAYTGSDGVARIILEVEAGQLENTFLAVQLLLEDMFIQTASLQALRQYGIQYNLPQKDGEVATGTLQFEGDGGTFVPAGTEVAYDPGLGIPVVYYVSTQNTTIPDPGFPLAPSAAVNASAGNLNGLYEYRVTFMTAEGETLPSADSVAVNPASQQVDLTNIPLGGAGTLSRAVYRDKDGAGIYRRVVVIANNTQTSYTDNITDATVAASQQMPTVDTAHRATVQGQAESSGSNANVAENSIGVLTSAPATLTGVTNPDPFTGGTDIEDSEIYRARLLAFVQNPQTGSPDDLKSWAEAIDGVESATIFRNDNLGTPTNGHVTVRIAGPNGTIPGSDVITAVQTALDEQDLANVTIHVATFTQTSINVTVDVTLASTFTLPDVTAQVQQAVKDYINGLDIGEVLRVAGLVDAVFGLAGVSDVTITTPTTNQTPAATAKWVPGTITVT